MNKLPYFKSAQVVGQLKLFSWLYERKAHLTQGKPQGSYHRVERQNVPQELQKHVEQLVSLGVVIKHYKKFRWSYAKQKVCCLQLVLKGVQEWPLEQRVAFAFDKMPKLKDNFGPIVEPLRPGPGAGIRFFLDGRQKPEPPPAVFSGQGIRDNIENTHVYDRNVNVGRMLLDMTGIKHNF